MIYAQKKAQKIHIFCAFFAHKLLFKGFKISHRRLVPVGIKR